MKTMLDQQKIDIRKTLAAMQEVAPMEEWEKWADAYSAVAAAVYNKKEREAARDKCQSIVPNELGNTVKKIKTSLKSERDFCEMHFNFVLGSEDCWKGNFEDLKAAGYY